MKRNTLPTHSKPLPGARSGWKQWQLETALPVDNIGRRFFLHGMRYNTQLILVAAFVLGLFPVEAAMVNQPARDLLRPDVVAKSTNRSFSGGVQSIAAGGLISLRDDKYGDIKVVITADTRISKGGGGTAELRDIAVGKRIHGYGSFRGGKYFAKVVNID